ncbi:TonB-dependent receptor, plug [Luminiphilus syltensis NOR5-1B]|uniref:TonB-dependent receptor, plug n=2 Tax=Luminiphilus TaxID=1341118 RepID=B8KTE3_9GAMM|nr:TonB-dependent receptor, plug [Luminiphilus syltensis NOR5-1B]
MCSAVAWSLTLAAATSLAQPVVAQDEGADAEDAISTSLVEPAASQDEDAASEEMVVEEVVVTGSKLRRNQFNSISPVQVIGAADSVRIGIADTTQMIAESPFVSGTQLDGSVNAGSTTGAVEGVSASGPGSATVALRGLGPERTLMLVNGRRLAPSGVRGAPVAPDLNLIPSAMIDRIEILTDGASSIYGADAVAGVVNIMLRDQFEGLEIRGFGTAPEQSGGEETQFSIIGGASNDKSNFTIAAEYFNREHIFARDRTDWNNCLLDIEVDPDSGQRYQQCLDNRPDNGVFLFSQGFVYDTPGVTDIGLPGWSSNAGAADYIGRSGFNALVGTAAETPYNLQQEELDTQLQGDIERINLYATGSFQYTPQQRLYIETSYSQRTNTDIFTSEQAFPAIPAMIPMVDADDNFIIDEGTGTIAMTDNPLNPFDETALPVYSLAGLTQRRATDIDNLRFVIGSDGDLPFAQDKGWFFDVFASYEESSGSSTQAGMFEPHIRESIDTLRMGPDGVTCGLPRTAPGFGFITPRDCVPVNYFADSLWTNRGGNKRFATQAEEDFLFGNVINTTTLKQTHFSGLITGDLFEMPAGTVGLVIGAEWRENSISSANDFVRAQGLSASEASDQEGDTVGTTDIWDIYAETELPLAEWATVNLSGRYTEEKNFGNEFTYSVKGQIMPTDSLRFRSTIGTTFRAPNLREQFLADQAGVIPGDADPCVVPNVANEGQVYIPENDTRDQLVLDNCVLAGVDPTALGLQANVLIPTTQGGSSDIGAETSDSFTLGFVYTQNFTDAFELDLSVTYFDIEVEDTVEELNPEVILDRCYSDDPDLANALCDRVIRRGVNPSNNTVARVDSSFVNLGLVTSSGYDVNVRFQNRFEVANTYVDMGWSLTGTIYDELLEQIDSEAPVEDRVGEAGFPEHSWILRGDFGVGNWLATYRARLIGEFSRDAENLQDSPNLPDRSACVALGGPDDCVRANAGGSETYHDLSLSYDADGWSATAGVRNVFDNQPPQIDQGSGPSRFNHLVQAGYDLFGRRMFLNVTKRF